MRNKLRFSWIMLFNLVIHWFPILTIYIRLANFSWGFLLIKKIFLFFFSTIFAQHCNKISRKSKIVDFSNGARGCWVSECDYRYSLSKKNPICHGLERPRGCKWKPLVFSLAARVRACGPWVPRGEEASPACVSRSEIRTTTTTTTSDPLEFIESPWGCCD